MARRPTGSLRRGWTTGGIAVDAVFFDRHGATLAHVGR
jgi:hypothetical protein